ncbi:MAG: glycosyltransferase [Ignavibacteria bacterium]|jgi:GT2 family glycosyltransferase|nr:glycosyltransferase [Ignavibacteria bacterium]
MPIKTVRVTKQQISEISQIAVPVNNPWLPWIDYGVKPSQQRGSILAIIPTTAKNKERLQRCLAALKNAANGVDLRIMLVVCPNTPEALQTAREVDTNAAIISLDPPFNFCRSINTAISEMRADEGYALLLNDDCFFTGTQDLKKLLDTLTQNGWACVGPWLDNRIKTEPDSNRTYQARRVNSPIPGTCVLWDRYWLKRVGQFDLAFGKGWGLDESDYSMRCLRLGGVWGRDESVLAIHEDHQSFGDHYANINSPAYHISLTAWREKYHMDATWGGDPWWNPLPGIHVAIAGNNVAPWIERCLDSVERAMAGYRWILTYADDASTDNSVELVKRHASSADHVGIMTFPKAANAGQAKNRAIFMGQLFRDRYPALMLMDADDVMGVDRVHHTLWRARDGGNLMVHGAFTHIGNKIPPDLSPIVQPQMIDQQLQGWIHPCSTVIHASLIPQDGKLFDETVPICEDALLFLQWWLNGIRSQALPGPIIHEYHIRANSVMYDQAVNKRDNLMVQYLLRRSHVLEQHITK